MEVKGLKEKQVVSPDTGIPDLDAMDCSSLPRSVHASQVERRPSSPVLSMDEMDDIIQRLTAVQARQTVLTQDFMLKRAESERLYLVTVAMFYFA
jgi:hypothetical protein